MATPERLVYDCKKFLPVKKGSSVYGRATRCSTTAALPAMLAELGVKWADLDAGQGRLA